MTVDRRWQQLLASLNTWAAAAEVAPDRIELELAGPDDVTRAVTIVMTPDDWDDFASTMWGDFDDAAQGLRRMIVEAPADQPFLVYGMYELVPSPTPELPDDPEDAAMDEMARRHPEGVGRWVVLDDDGSVIDELGASPLRRLGFRVRRALRRR